MATKISNVSDGPLTLPYPLTGILGPGDSVQVSASVATLLAAIPTSLIGGVMQLTEVQRADGPDDAYLGYLTSGPPINPLQVTTAMIAAAAVTSAKIANNAITNPQLAADAVDAVNLDNVAQLVGASAVGLVGVPFVIIGTFTAGVTGQADDVLVTDVGIPGKCILIDAKLSVTTAKGAATVTLRDAAAGAGNALSNAISVAATGLIPWVPPSLPTLAAGSGIYLRRSDRACAGSVILTLAMTA